MKYIYNKDKKITEEEAHQLEDKSGLCSSDKEIKFKKEKKNGSRRPNTNKRSKH